MMPMRAQRFVLLWTLFCASCGPPARTAVVAPVGPVRSVAPPSHVDPTYWVDVAQVVVDGSLTYLLLKNGNVFLDEGAGPRLYDDGTGTRQIAADRGACYVLKDNGNIWRRQGATPWVKIDSGTGTRQVLAAGGGVFLLKEDGAVFQWNGKEWIVIDVATGSVQLAGDPASNLYTLKQNGNIFRRGEDGDWVKVDDGTATRQIAASHGMVYALKENGNVWRRKNEKWALVDDGTGTKMIEADGDRLFILKDDGAIWLLADDKLSQVHKDGSARAIEAAGGWLYVLERDGKLLRESREILPAY